MPLPPSVSSTVVEQVGSLVEILANSENLVQFSGMLARFDENDWCEFYDAGGPTRVLTPVFPQGALLGFQVASPADWAQAFDAGRETTGAIPTQADRCVYTWGAAALGAASRGSGLNATIPASTDGQAVVLANDADVTDYTAAADGNLLVSLIWSGNFHARGIVQDAESYDTQPFPENEGGCDRLAIMPLYGNMVG
jgi:hypothetical protein